MGRFIEVKAKSQPGFSKGYGLAELVLRFAKPEKLMTDANKVDVAICQGGVRFTARPNIWHRCCDGVTSETKSHRVHRTYAAREMGTA